MKKLLCIFLIIIVSNVSFAQSSKGKSVTDCDELKFWMKEIQAEFKNIQLTETNGKLSSKRLFKGFDNTEYKIFDEGKSFELIGVASSLKNKKANRVLFKKLVELVNSCNLQLKQSEEGFWDREEFGLGYFQNYLPEGTHIAIKLQWSAKNENNKTFENLSCTIYFSK